MSLIISDSEPSGNPNRSVTARPSRLPLVINGVPDTTRLHKASFGDNLQWYLELPWPSETDPSDVQWVIIRSDGTEYAGHVPEGITGPLSLDDLLVHHGWSTVVPLGPPGGNPLPPEVFIFRGPVIPPVQDTNPPKITAVGEHSLIISDSEPSGLPGGRSVTARPSSLPLSINGVPDISRFHVASFADNLRWYLALPWPSETDPGDIQWIVIRSDGTEYAGHIPEGIRGPLTLDDLVVNYGWGVVIPPPLGPIEDNLLPTVGGDVSVIQGPMGPAPVYDLLANRPSASVAGDRTLFVATDLNGSTLFEVQTILGTPIWVQIGIGALDARLSDSRTPILHAPTHGSLGSDPVALDAGQITSGTLPLARLSGLSHSQLDASAGIRGTQIHDVPVTLLTGLLGTAQGGLGLDASGALARELLLGTGSGAFTLEFLAPGDIPGLDASKLVSGTLSLSRLSGITGAQLSGTAGITSGQIASVAASTLTGVLSSAQFSLVPGDIPGLDASKITSGTLALGRLSGITTNQLSPAAGIVSSQIASVLAGALQGTINSFNLSLVPGDIPGLDASKITSGTLALGRLSGITGGQLSGTAGITSGQIASVSTSTLVGVIGSSHLSLVPGDIPGLDASKITTGVFTVGLIPGLNAAKITSGTLALARGGTGLDSSGATNGQLLIGTGSGFSLATLTAGDNITITNSSGGITIACIISSAVTSVGLAAPSEFSVSGSPVTGTGTLTFTKLNQNANLVYAGPTTGSSGTPTFRYLVAADIPTLPASRITGGQLATARGGTGLDTSSAANGQLLIGTGTGLALATLTAGTGITITNTSGHIQIDGATTYTLPIASASVLGGIKVGSNLAIDGTGVLSGTYSYSLPVASTSVLGGVKQGSNVTIDGSGIISVAAPYSLPTASASVLGGIKVGSGLSIDGGGILSAIGGSGTVTSVSLTAPSEISVTGSPVTSSGTIALTWVSETQHFVFAGPSGSSGIPGFRALLASDIPVLSYVTSVALTVPADFGLSGSPITSSGTLGLTWNAQTGSVVMASPSGGGSGTPTFRSLVSGDIPSLDVAKITTGTFATSFIPNLDTSKITTGRFTSAFIPTDVAYTDVANTFTASPQKFTTITATPDYGTLSLGDAPFDGTSPDHFVGNSGGTYIAINANALFNGDFLRFESAGNDELLVSNALGFISLKLTDVISGSWAFLAPNELDTHNFFTGAATTLQDDELALSLPGQFTIIKSGSIFVSDGFDQIGEILELGAAGFSITGNIWSNSIPGTYYAANANPGTRILQDTAGTIRLQISEVEPLLSAFTTWNDALVVNADTSVHAYAGLTVDGTLTLASQTQNYVFAAPSGSSGVPGFRALVSSDIPALSYVTSVAMTVPADFGISGSPITASGTLGLTWNSQTGNVVMASPSGGGSGTPTFRSLVAGDIPNLDTGKITTGTLTLARLSGITTTELSATAGIVAGQIASVNPSVLTGSGTVPLAGLSGITTSQLSATAGITSGQIASIPNQNASIITTGTLALAQGGTNTDNSSVAINQVWAGPSSGSTGAALYRALVAADIPSLDAGKITTGTFAAARMPTADASNLGAIKVGTTLSIASGVLDYTLPTASASVLGAIKIGSGLSIASGVLSTVNNGTVTSVAMTVPADFAISGSAITSSGTLGLTWNAQTGNVVMASPSGGGSGTPTFRSLVAADIPSLDVAKITTGTFATSFIPSLDTSKITTGTFSLARLSGITTTELSATAGIVAAQIASINPSVLTGSGTVPLAALSGITTTQLSASAGIVAAQVASVNPSVLTGSGTVPLAALTGITTTQLSATAGITSGQIASIPNQNASIITTGTLALSRGGTNTDNSSVTVNQVWAGPSSGSTGSALYRSLVVADLPADVAYTDVANTFTLGQTINGTLNAGNSIFTLSGSNSVIIKSSTKAIRLRLSGATTDLEIGATGLVMSTWDNADFTGTQRAYFALDFDAQKTRFYLGAFPDTDNNLELGASDKHWRNIYSQTLVLNATASIDGITAGLVNLTGNLTVSGTLSLPSQTQNQVFAAPSDSSGVPGFRVLRANDNPDILAMMWMEAS